MGEQGTSRTPYICPSTHLYKHCLVPQKNPHHHQQNATNLWGYLNALAFFSICGPTALLKCCSKCSPPFIHKETVHLRSSKFTLDLVSIFQGRNQTQGGKENVGITSMGSMGKKNQELCPVQKDLGLERWGLLVKRSNRASTH